MCRPLFRLGRWVTLLLAGGGIAGLVLHSSNSFTENVSAAVSASPATQPIDDPQTLEAADTIQLAGLQSKFETVAQRVGPAVVAISAAETATDYDAAYRAAEMNGQKLEDVLGKTTRTVGTGFIFDSNGFILTNEHVIEDSEQYWVTTDDHRVYPAIVVAADPRADLAVMKIPAANLPTVEFRTTPCQRGQWSITLGNPYGLATEGEMSLSVGVISAVDRALPRLATRENRLYSHLLQTTAEINPGNSGGPLFDIEGRVIGINAAVILPQKQTNGIGFAIPVTPALLAEADALKQGHEVVYGYLGVIVTTPTISERHEANLSQDEGVRIESVEELSPAAGGGGLRPGDIVATLNDQTIGDSDQFVRLVGASPIGRPIKLRALRSGGWLDLQITPIKRPVPFAVSNQNQRMHWRGMVIGPIPQNWLGAGGTGGTGSHPAGLLVIGINNDSPMKKQGIDAGSVITAIGGRPVTSMLDMQKILNDLPAEKCSVEIAPTPSQVVSVQK
jgi:serine protease Do